MIDPLNFVLRAKECQKWTDSSVRHCNAFHKKDGIWSFIRMKYKERREKEKNLLEVKRGLREERKKKKKKREKER